jgi:hypothetical protein
VAVTDHEGPETVPLGNPPRTATFVMFGDPDYFFQTFVPAGSPNDGVNPGFAWGGVLPRKSPTLPCWRIRPTLLGLLGLRGDHQSQGRAFAEDLQRWALPEGVSESGDESQSWRAPTSASSSSG